MFKNKNHLTKCSKTMFTCLTNTILTILLTNKLTKKPKIQISKITTIYNRLDLMKRSPSGAHSKNTTPNQLAASKQAK